MLDLFSKIHHLEANITARDVVRAMFMEYVHCVPSVPALCGELDDYRTWNFDSYMHRLRW